MSSSDDDDDLRDARRPGAPAIGADPRLQHNGVLHSISLQPAPLPSLEAINLKFSQIIEGIVSLARLIDADGDRGMAAWPDILTKYNFLLSQSHLLSQTLSTAVASAATHPDETSASRPALSLLPRLVLHPTSATPEDQSLDFRVEGLLRTMLLPSMVEQESSILEAFRGDQKVNEDEEPVAYEHLEAKRKAHDDTVSRALEGARALREQYDWTTRVFVATPEDVPQSPPAVHVTALSPGRGARGADDADPEMEDGSELGDVDMPGEGSEAGTNTSDDAFLLEGELEDDKDEATPSDSSRA